MLARYADLQQDDGSRLYDANKADQALMNALAFWTGCDVDRMIRLFSQSNLAKFNPDGSERTKWFKRAYYRNRTIGNSIRSCRVVYNGNAIERRTAQMAHAQAVGEQDIEDLKAPILTLDDMLARFYLVLDGNKESVGMIDRTIRKPRSMTQASIYYNASKHDIPTGKVDPTTGIDITKQVEALNVWKSHPDRMNVDMVTWLPDGPEITRDAERNGTAFNIWTGLIKPTYTDWFCDPANVAVRNEVLQAWHVHLAYLIPIAAERRRFEQWLAHILQKPGELPQTAYLMFTDGVTGIGRGWLSIVLANVLRGYTALGVDISAAVDDKGFNGRLSRKLLATVDEAKAGMDSSQKYQRAETLKSRINEKLRFIKNKYGMEWTEYNCMRWLFFSNHADALPFDHQDRRIIVIANPNTRATDQYYEWLYWWSAGPRKEEFFSVVWSHLMSLDISSFKPGEHAPMNHAKRKALDTMDNPLVKALREWLSETDDNGALIRTDLISSVASITDALRLEHDIANVHPRVLSHAFKTVGLETFDKKVKVLGRTQTLAIINPRQYSVADFWDHETGEWRNGATDKLQFALSSGGKLPQIT